MPLELTLWASVLGSGEIEVPVGTLSFWAKNFPGVPALDDDWLECDGSIINDPESPMDGETLPDLNGDSRFLRAQATSGAVGGEATHPLTLGELAAHTHEYVKGNITTVVTAAFGFSDKRTRTESTVDTSSTGSGQAHENRPPFYNAVVIMKIK